MSPVKFPIASKASIIERRVSSIIVCCNLLLSVVTIFLLDIICKSRREQLCGFDFAAKTAILVGVTGFRTCVCAANQLDLQFSHRKHDRIASRFERFFTATFNLKTQGESVTLPLCFLVARMQLYPNPKYPQKARFSSHIRSSESAKSDRCTGKSC